MQQNPIPILMYHSIAKMPKGTIMRNLHVPPKLFRLQMWLLKIFGYKGLNLTQLLPYLNGEKFGKVVGITFDDGFKNNLTYAQPILQKYGFSATCYIISNKIGGINDWDLKKGIPENPLMNKGEIKSWIDGGMEIGSHGQNHVHLSEVGITTAKKEISQSKKDLEKEFKQPVLHFCYPYGSYNKEVLTAVKAEGYITSTTVNRSRVSVERKLLELPRIPISHRTFAHLFILKILTRYEDRRL